MHGVPATTQISTASSTVTMTVAAASPAVRPLRPPTSAAVSTMDARRVCRAAAAAIVAAAAAAAVALSIAARTATAGDTPSVAPPPAPVHAALRAPPPPPPPTPSSPALTSFGSCRSQGDYFRTAAASDEVLSRLWDRYARDVRRRPIFIDWANAGGGAVGGGGADATGPNGPVGGVDEADTIKGDGSVQYVVSNRTLHVLAVRRGGADAVRVGAWRSGGRRRSSPTARRCWSLGGPPGDASAPTRGGRSPA